MKTRTRRTAIILLSATVLFGFKSEFLRAETPLKALPARTIVGTGEQLQAMTRAASGKCIASTVGLIGTRGEDSNGISSGSGVIVSADGLILTAGHVVAKPNALLTIRFADGKVVNGISLGLDHALDTGMARITDKAPEGGWPFSPVAPDNSVKIGDWLLTTGNPGGIVLDRNPPVRLGRASSVDASKIQSNCAMEPGDSGGPVFDLHGRVVGINSRIATGTFANTDYASFHVPVSLYSMQWKDLLAGMNAHPEVVLGSRRSRRGPNVGNFGRLGEALQKLAAKGDAEAKKILEDAKVNGGQMTLSGDQVQALIRRAGLDAPTTKSANGPTTAPSLAATTAPSTRPTTQAVNTPTTNPGTTRPTTLASTQPLSKGIAANLRAKLGPQLKRSLLQQFPDAKISDDLLGRMMDKGSYNESTREIHVAPDTSDMREMGVVPAGRGLFNYSQANRLMTDASKMSLQTLSFFAPALNLAGDCMVEIRTATDKPVMLGTIVDETGLILTKASDLPDQPLVVLSDGQRVKATLVGKDDATDLALIKIATKQLTAVSFADDADLGSLIIAPTANPNQPAVGIVSLRTRSIPITFSHFVGEQKVILGLGFNNNSMIVGQITPDMPADSAGIKEGDEVIELNGKSYSDSKLFVAEVKKAQTGQTLTIKVKRGGKELTFTPLLGERKSSTQASKGIGEADDLAGGKLSKRRTNFPLAIQHDAALWADQVGGPLINLKGETIGINIARYDRVCTFAIPADLAKKTIEKLKSKAK